MAKRRKKKEKPIGQLLKYVLIGVAVLSLLTLITGRSYVKDYQAELDRTVDDRTITEKFTDKNGKNKDDSGDSTSDGNAANSDGTSDTESGAGTTEYTAPAMNKTKYMGDSVKVRECYEDKSSRPKKFIDSQNEAGLEAAVKEFYKKTGVYPYIYIIEETEFPSYDLSVKYRDVFGDSEENFIILYAVTVYERHGETHDGFYFGVGNNVEGTIDTDVRRVILESMESRMDGKHDMADVFGKALKDAASLFGEQYE